MTRRSNWAKKHGEYTLRSGFEQRVAQHLDSKKIKYEYETEKLPYVVPETPRVYTPDFVIKRKGRGKKDLYIECKGRWTAEDRKKMVQVIEQHPDKDIRILFMVDNPITKKSKTTYTMWASARGIKCAVSRDGTIPEEWLK